MLLITSFNANLYEQYAKRMIHEFSEKSDQSVKLLVIFEGDELPKVNIPNVELVSFNNPGHKGFIKKFGHLYEARGYKVLKNTNNQLHFSYDLNFDAVKFSFKVFALLQALSIIGHDIDFAWIDADIRCLRTFGKNDLFRFFPDNDQLMSYLGRNNFPPKGAYSECGFLAFNPKHSSTLLFLERVASIYLSGEIFAFEQWHDSWIWDRVRTEFEKEGVSFKNISGVAADTQHPFINCDLGKFFDHLKGPSRKKNGLSFDDDYRLRERNDY
jgi:hypothetical protein